MGNFNIFLKRSADIRKMYIEKLSKADPGFREKWLKHFDYLPGFFEEIYSICNGTDAEIEEQVYFDFIPGFRLMQIDEIIQKYEKEFKNCQEFKLVIPFLTDYGDFYYAYVKREDIESIAYISDEGMEIVHNDISSFWKTIIAFYDENVYYLDEDGYLSYDFDKEGEIGRKYNFGIDYWN